MPCAAKNVKRRDHGVVETAQRPDGRGRNLWRCARDERIRAPRLGRVHRCRDAHAHEHGHQPIRDLPARARGNVEDQRLRDQDCGAITELVRRGHEAQLLGAARAFDAPSVDRDVLRRGRESHDDRERTEDDEALLRPDRHHRHEADDDAKLREHDPTAPLAEPAEHGQLDAVEQGRPDELQRIREPDPRDEADCRELGAFFAQPRTERVARQKERQAGRETEREHREHTRLA